MRIGIDARMFGAKTGGGIGRYVEQLVSGLQEIDTQNQYVIFLKPENAEACRLTNPRFEKRVIPIRWYTIKEQIRLGPMMDREQLDLIHFPHWNVPMTLKTKFIVTVHDLILLEEPLSTKATTRHPLVYLLKYALYRKVIARTIRRAEKIIAVSKYTKTAILRFFPKTKEEKIHVIYEGVVKLPETASPTAPMQNPFLLYVGSAYPHKNLQFLIRAFKKIHATRPDLSLVLAGHDDVFYARLQKETRDDHIQFFLDPSDADLSSLYQNASAFVFPSKTEGFGLPPLEAMAFNLPVVCSNGGSLPEIVGNAALFFDPKNESDLISQIKIALSDEHVRQRLVEEGRRQRAKYSWSTMVQETKDLFEIWRKETKI